MKINEKIKSRRQELGLTLEEVGNYVGVSKATVQRYESGEIKNLKLMTIEKLSQILKVTPAYLMGWEDAKDVDVPEEYTKKYKVTKKDLNQYEDVLNHAEAFMMDDKVDPEDKQKLFEIVSKLYWESKATNKEKYGKKKGNK
mgnify:CR=1 FL=1